MAESAEPLRDERPSGPCLQTFFRNHEVISQTLRSACLARPRRLRILTVGGGVLEPLLVAALCELFHDAGQLDDYEITCLDLSADVAEIHDHLRAGRAYQDRGHQVVSADGRLSLPGLARVFSATHAEVNSWLIDPVALSGQLQEWIDLGVARYLGIPPDICHSTERMVRFVAEGFDVPRRLVDGLRTVCGDVGSPDPPPVAAGWADVVVSNYALQYPIWAGNGELALRNLESWLAPDAIGQIGNAYSAQGQLLALVDRVGQRLAGWPVEFALRESFIVAQYADDAPDEPPRLVSRADVFFASELDRLPGLPGQAIERFTRHHGGRAVQFGSLGELSELVKLHSGLPDDSLVVHQARWNPDEGAGVAHLVPRDVMLSFGRNPMRPRGLYGRPAR